MYGDACDYLNEAKEKITHGVVVVRSLQWPGSYTFYANGSMTQVYIGNGQKFDPTPIQYITAPLMVEDPPEYADCPEPNPINEP